MFAVLNGSFLIFIEPLPFNNPPSKSMKNSSFKGSMSDALDVDFSSGSIDSIKFENIANDAIDISGTKYSPLKGPELPKFVTAKGDASFSKTGAGKGAIRIQKGATRSDINILRAGQKIAKKSGPAKGLVKTGSKILSKLGPKGRLGALALTGFAASPFGRKTIGTLATAGGLTALFGGGKKEKQLKVGDGLKNVGKVRVTADSRGLKRNQADMAKIKATQKNFIDKYNKGRVFGKIKYNVNKQGTYDVIKPKKK